jgi:serine/threonine-protein kinase
MQQGFLLAGKYKLLSLLGEGGMGSVWRAEHLGLNAPVAVKVLNPAIATTGEGLARFQREATAAAALRSPHVVQILDQGFDAATHQPFIVMELMEGESLAGRISRLGRLNPERTAVVVTHIARALARAHDAGIVHRDLKPDNVFLVRNDDEEIAKVLDFGIAKSETHKLAGNMGTRTGTVMGTPYYMSPEQISGSKSVDFRTDLFALGVIACECLTGRRPFEADSIGGLALKICAEPPPRPSALSPVPAGFDAWFERAVARDPAGRFGSAREMADALRRLCGVSAGTADAATENEPEPPAGVHTASTGPLARTADRGGAETRPSGSGTRWSFAVGAALVAAMTGALLWMQRGDQPAPISEPSAAAVVPSGPESEPVAATATATEPSVASTKSAEPAALASSPAPLPIAASPERKPPSAVRPRASKSAAPVAAIASAPVAAPAPPPVAPVSTAPVKATPKPPELSDAISERR